VEAGAGTAHHTGAYAGVVQAWEAGHSWFWLPSGRMGSPLLTVPLF
jgi:hypothetical protein